MKTFLLSVKNKFHQKMEFFATLTITMMLIDVPIALFLLINVSIEPKSSHLPFSLSFFTLMETLTLTIFPIPLIAMFLGLVISPSIKHKKHLKNMDWLKEEENTPLMYRLFLIKQLSKHFQNLTEVQDLIINIENKTIPHSEFDSFAYHFYFQKTKKSQDRFISQFLEMNLSYLDKSTEELESMLQEKIKHYIEKSPENKIINNFIASQQKPENKTLSLNI